MRAHIFVALIVMFFFRRRYINFEKEIEINFEIKNETIFRFEIEAMYYFGYINDDEMMNRCLHFVLSEKRCWF